jgi:hypothetical protein
MEMLDEKPELTLKEVKKFLENIKENPNYKDINLPNYIYEDVIPLGKFNKKFIEHLYVLNICIKNIKYVKQIIGKTLQFPPNIKYLIINKVSHIQCRLDFSQATDLEYLEFNASIEYFVKYYIHNWPPNLKYAILNGYYYSLNNLPPTLSYLRLGLLYEQELNNLPANLIYLEFPEYSRYNTSLDYLPHGLKFLSFGFNSHFDQPLDYLPSSLTSLKIYNMSYSHVLNNIPDGITELLIYIDNNLLEYYVLPVLEAHNDIREFNIRIMFSADFEFDDTNLNNFIDKISFPKKIINPYIALRYINPKHAKLFIKKLNKKYNTNINFKIVKI